MPNQALFPESRTSATVLVVDHERIVREMLDRWLRAGGYQSKSAANVTEALEVIGQNSIDLVITDIDLPGQSGFDLLLHLQGLRVDLPVLMLTACEDPRFAAKAMTHGACGYLLKPVELKDLLFQVARALERQRLLFDAHNRVLRLEKQISEQTRMVRMAYEEVIHRLIVASMVRDDETGAHTKRIGVFSAAVAASAGWSAKSVDHLRLAAPMHDIGKIGIPDAILLKPGKLTAEEFEIMKSHTIIGADILKNSPSPIMHLAEQIARSHHERWDGTGYPDGVGGEAIPQAARVVAIVDVYDALTHARVYRPAVSEAETLDILRQGRAKQFDPELLDVFFDALPNIRELAQQNTDYESSSCGSGTSEAVRMFKRHDVVECDLSRLLGDCVETASMECADDDVEFLLNSRP